MEVQVQELEKYLHVSTINFQTSVHNYRTTSSGHNRSQVKNFTGPVSCLNELFIQFTVEL